MHVKDVQLKGDQKVPPNYSIVYVLFGKTSLE